MALTAAERAELRRLEARARALRSKKNAEAKQRSAQERRKREQAIDRSRKEQRQPRERDNAYLAWLRRQSCVVGAIAGWPCSGRIDPAHIRYSDARAGKLNPGAGRKPDDKWCLPVCRTHHDAQHAYGDERKWWCSEVGVDAIDLARAVHGAFQADQPIESALRPFTPSRKDAA